MKSNRSKMVASGIVAVMMSVFVGCNLQPEQVKAVAQQAGLFSAVGWIATDNPDKATVDAVKAVLGTIEAKAGNVESGSTYTEVIYPEVEKVIDSDIVDPQYRPAAKVASITLLGSIDMLFAANPEWRAQQDVALGVVESFVRGAKSGLGLSRDSEIIVAARETASRRARVYQK